MKLKHRLTNSDLTIEEVSFLLNIPFSDLKQAITNPKYITFNIPKKSGGVRMISAPSFDLKEKQFAVNKKFRSVYHMIQPNCVHGFTYKTSKEKFKDIGIKANAQMHIGKKFILNIDIKDFFPSIKINGVRNLFLNPPFKYSLNLATGMALLVCYKKALPAGAPSSPLISNLYCLSMDAELLKLSESAGITYSRYADDLTFSSNETIEEVFANKVAQILEDFGFEINRKKFRQATQYQAQYVTGIKVNQKLNLNRTYYRNLRAVLHSIEQVGITTAMIKYKGKNSYIIGDEHRFLASVRSKIEYLGYIRGSNDILYRELKMKFKELQNRG